MSNDKSNRIIYKGSGSPSFFLGQRSVEVGEVLVLDWVSFNDDHEEYRFEQPAFFTVVSVEPAKTKHGFNTFKLTVRSSKDGEVFEFPVDSTEWLKRVDEWWRKLVVPSVIYRDNELESCQRLCRIYRELLVDIGREASTNNAVMADRQQQLKEAGCG